MFLCRPRHLSSAVTAESDLWTRQHWESRLYPVILLLLSTSNHQQHMCQLTADTKWLQIKFGNIDWILIDLQVFSRVLLILVEGWRLYIVIYWSEEDFQRDREKPRWVRVLGISSWALWKCAVQNLQSWHLLGAPRLAAAVGVDIAGILSYT